jgi:peptidoglycan/LPS O-acetylase OafA/YrhL
MVRSRQFLHRGLGVYTFFVISGFIMIDMSCDDSGHLPKAFSFATRRIIRIVPTFWMATLLAFAIYTVLSLSRHPSWLNLFEPLTFVADRTYAVPTERDCEGRRHDSECPAIEPFSLDRDKIDDGHVTPRR